MNEEIIWRSPGAYRVEREAERYVIEYRLATDVHLDPWRIYKIIHNDVNPDHIAATTVLAQAQQLAEWGFDTNIGYNIPIIAVRVVRKTL